ncbi:MAG: hypothetical protein LBU35_00745 [Holosporales bacterium]|jgi:hypothetical protein|nr:hypothetical protein [Holosporales bacterium]
MKRNNFPKAKFFSDPFIAGYTDIDKENSDITIGNSEKNENIFFGDENSPEYISCLCSLIPRMEFKNISVSSKYKLDPDSGAESEMNFKIYSGENINMKGFVSHIDIECRNILLNGLEGNIPREWLDFIIEHCKIFTKNFMTQTNSIEIESLIDEELGITDIAHFKSNAHFFAGSYYKGIPISDIQQYMFFVGTDVYGKEYINIISSKEILTSSSILPAAEIKLENLSTLQDDISNGKVSISFSESVIYKSIEIRKETLTSDICKIIFKKA